MFKPSPRHRSSGLRRRPSCWQQAVAWLGAGLIGILTWLAADPGAHEYFHFERAPAALEAHDHADRAHNHAAGEGHDTHDEHQCIVTDFAAGATDVIVVSLLVFASLRLIARIATPSSALVLPAARFRHAPTCGPPA